MFDGTSTFIAVGQESDINAFLLDKPDGDPFCGP
jgi:hypothetical protein